MNAPKKSIALEIGLTLSRAVFLFALLELALRIFGVASEEDYVPARLIRIIENGEIQGEFTTNEGDLFFPVKGNEELIQNNPSYWSGQGAGYYPHAGSMRRLEFSAVPSQDRYFVLGGSAALGQQPVNIKTTMNWSTIRLDNSVLALDEKISISGRVEAKLRNASVQAEVLNAGIIAQDSGGLRRIAQQCLEHQPKGLLLYLGNNEGIGMALGMEGETLSDD